MEKGTRHKSCVACIQTKRKCDRAQPNCQRCIARGSDCHYIGRKRKRQQQLVEQSTSNLPGAVAHEWRLQSLEAEPMISATSFPPSLNEQLFEFPNHPFNLSLEPQSLIPNIGDLVTQQHSHITNADSKLYARVDYCATRLSLLPNVFATSGQNTFIHRQTFQSLQSPALQQAMSACALNCMKMPTTKPLVHQVLQHNVRHLLATTDPASSSNPDLLAALQALLLYQLMRLFDGDVGLRAAAEADEPTTVLWASELRTRVCAIALALNPPAAHNPVAALSSNPGDWQAWLFSESIRRTVVTTFLLRGVYNYLKTGTDTTTVVGVYFTVQQGLWNAQSEAGWKRTRNERLELQVLVNCWDEMMALAGPDDLEELGVQVMSMLWGLTATQNWLGYEHSIRYGLDDQTLCQDTQGLR